MAIKYRDTDPKTHYERYVTRSLVKHSKPGPEPANQDQLANLLAQYGAAALAAHGGAVAHFVDVGCNVALLGDRLPSGVVYEGVEANPHAAERAMRRGLRVSGEFTRATYDVVFARQMIQFLSDVPGFLADLAAKVAPRGILFLVQAVPYGLSAPHHFNAIDQVEDLTACLSGLSLERARPMDDISPSEFVIIGRKS